jgi:hypothetical protein
MEKGRDHNAMTRDGQPGTVVQAAATTPFARSGD